MRRTRKRLLSAPLLVILATTLAAGALWAHDFWIVPDAFQIETGGVVTVRGQTGTKFPTSVSALTLERIAEARLIGASSEERLTDLSVSGKSLLIRHRPSTPGQRIVAVTLVSRSTRTTPAALKRYIALEGAPRLAERYDRDGAFPKTDSVTQISQKFAKTIVEIGRDGPRAFAQAVSHGLEIVPVNDPALLRAGDTLVVRLLYHGEPVAAAHLHAGAAPSDITATSDSAAVAGAVAPREMVVETGPDGTARIPVGEQGLWNVRALHAAAAAADTWEVYFATLVFAVGGRE